MKSFLKAVGIIAFVAIIGFTMIGCEDKPAGPGATLTITGFKAIDVAADATTISSIKFYESASDLVCDIDAVSASSFTSIARTPVKTNADGSKEDGKVTIGW